MKIILRLISTLALVTAILCTSAAQDLDMSLLEKLEFRNVGPAGMSGRVTAIDVDLKRPHRIFVGTASGGLWLSEDGGVAWKPIFDVEETQSIGSVKINQLNTDEIWVGTGEGNPRNTQNSGKGIYKTMDGGRTWKRMGLEDSRVIHRIVIDHLDPNIVYAGVTGSQWGPAEARGVYKTTDGGETWSKILFVNDSTGVADMVMDPFNHKKLLVAMWEHSRKPWTFKSGGEGSGLYMTYDGGQTWKEITDEEGLPKGELGRIGLAIARNKPNIIYALVEAKENGLYKSTDGGHEWKLVSKKDIGNRPFYYSDIFVDPSNENRIWNLWSYVSKSEDGGRTFETILDYGKGVHPDHHAFWQSPDDPLYLIEGNDGGVNISRDGGHNWRFISNLPVGQFYHINYDMDIPYNLYGGMQDNGTWVGPAYVWKRGGIRNADYREVMFGDGFDVMPRRDNNRYGWAMSQGGNLGYYDYETGFTQTMRPVHPEGERLRFNWNAAIAQDPFDDASIYYGSQYVHYSTDYGKSWEIISPDLTTNDSSKQRQDISGGLTVDATQAENHTTILCIAPSPVDADVIWAGTDDGRLHITRNGGEDWTSLESRLPGCPEGAWIPQIEVSTTDAGMAYVVVNNYRMNDWGAYLYYTDDYGATFTRLVDDGDIGSFVCSVVSDPVEPNLLFLGADDGLYMSLDQGSSWQKWPRKSFPSVQVRDLKIHPREHDLCVATFGRAFWVLDDIRPLRELAADGVERLDSTFALFNAPDAYMASYRSVDGIRFTADAEFIGDNRPGGARFTYWLKPEEKDSTKSEITQGEDRQKESEDQGEEPSKKNKRPKKAKFYIIDSQFDTIRHFSHKSKDGFNQISWGMRRDGVRYPSRRERPQDADPPGGRSVLPGTYTLIGVYGDYKDSTVIRVHSDPRIDIDEDMLREQDATLASYESLVERAADGFDQLRNAKATVGIVNGAIVNAPDSTRKRVEKLGKELNKRIDELMELYMQPEDLKGIHGATHYLMTSLGRANSLLRRSVGPAGDNAMNAVLNARNELEDVLEKVNAFVDEDWTAYKEEIGKIQFDLFKEVENVD